MGQILFNVAEPVDSGYSGDPINFLIHTTDYGEDTQAVILENGGSQGSIEPHTLKSDVLQDGRVVTAGGEDYAVTVTCYEVGSTSSVSWTTDITGYTCYYWVNIKVLTNNNIVITWVGDDPGYEYGWYVMLDSDGNVLSGPLRYDGDNGSYEDYDSMVALPDGGWAVVYDQYPGGPSDADFIAIREADGTSRVTVWPSYNSADDSANRLNVFPNGIIARFYSGDNSLYAFNPTTGAEVVTAAAFTTTGNSYAIVSAALSTWTDKLAVFIGDSVNDVILGTIIHSDGTHPDVYDKIVYTGDETWAQPKAVDVVVNQNDQFVLQFTDSSSSWGYGNYYVLLDENLDIISAGADGGAPNYERQAFTGMTGGVPGRADEGTTEGCAI